MSDFTSNFWSVFVAASTIIGIIACLLLLWFSGKGKRKLPWMRWSESRMN